jgi:hypothetical protein
VLHSLGKPAVPILGLQIAESTLGVDVGRPVVPEP